MSNNMTKSRNSSFEVLRIISMFMIVLHHFIVHGIMNNPLYSDVFLNGSLCNRFFAWLYFPGGEVGVALFFMITGFFCINSEKIRIKKVILEVIFYAWLSLLIYTVLRIYGVEMELYIPWKDAKGFIIQSIIFPIRSGYFWFATSYVLLQLFLPVYNPFLKKLNNKGIILIITILLLFLLQSQFFIICLGYTKALFFYTIGGFIRKISENKPIKTRWWGRYICLVLFVISWILYAFIKFFLGNMQFTGIIKTIFMLFYTIFPSCILVTVCAVSLFIFFARLNLGEKKAINTISITTFGIYLIHDSKFIRFFLWNKIVNANNIFNSTIFPLLAPLIAFCIFCVCSIVDLIRVKLIEPFAIKKIDILIEKFKNKFQGDL